MTDFPSRLRRRILQHGPLCIGIDPAAQSLAQCGLPNSAEGAFEFGSRVLEAADFQLAIVKPQMAFFERFGSAGIRALEELAALARRKELLVLLDAKRGDIDTTGAAYAEAYFSPSSPLRVDAVTVHPYLGFGALEKLLSFAVRHGGGVFVVVRSSNAEGIALQTARLDDGGTVAADLCARITAFNRSLREDTVGPIGAVVGATCHDAAQTVTELPCSYVLAPGIGAQGATLDDVFTRMAPARGRVLPSVSRAIMADGCSASDIGTAIRALKEHARRILL